MKNYFDNVVVRKRVQTWVCIAQAVLAALAFTFMLLFVTTPAPSEQDFSVLAILFTIVWGVFWLLQLLLAVVTMIKTAPCDKQDKMFLIVSICFAPVCALVLWIFTLIL